MGSGAGVIGIAMVPGVVVLFRVVRRLAVVLRTVLLRAVVLRVVLRLAGERLAALLLVVLRFGGILPPPVERDSSIVIRFNLLRGSMTRAGSAIEATSLEHRALRA